MGCDIHVVLERKYVTQDRNGKNRREYWDCLSPIKAYDYYAHPAKKLEDLELRISDFEIANFRNYMVFSYLAGVRGPINNEFVKKRGIPSDVSSLVKLLWVNDSDLHSHTWYSLKELIEFVYNCDDFSPLASNQYYQDGLNAENEDEYYTWSCFSMFLDDTVNFIERKDLTPYRPTKDKYGSLLEEVYNNYADDYRLLIAFDN